MSRMTLHRVTLGASLMALMASTLHAEPAPALVAATTTFADLTIAPGQIPAAPAGKQLTLSVDGVELPLAPGHYTGAVTLSVTDDIPVNYHDVLKHNFRAGAYVQDGALVAGKSALATVTGATITDGVIQNARITSRAERFNGIIITGKGHYRLDHPVIEMTGNGGNDFAGYGAAITATGDAQLTIERPVIRTHGAIRTAVFVGGNATVHINDADIEVLNGTLPADYTFTVDMGRMMEVPWMLGLSGNVRATNLVGNGTVYYNRSHIRAQGWGAMSTDDSTHVRMFVNDSLIEVTESGYGCYSIGDSIDTFTRSTIRAADIGCIMAAEGSVVFTEGTHVQSGRYGVMMHSGDGGGRLVIDKGSVMQSAQTAIQVKGLGTTILVDGARVTAGNGILLQSMENDDPFMKAMMRGEIPAGMLAPPPGVAAAAPKPKPSPDVLATFRNTALVGDMFNARPTGSAMVLTFAGAQITGRLSTATVVAAKGVEPTRATLTEIGHVVNTPGAVAGGKGLKVSLDGASRWRVTGTSYLTDLTLAPGARLEAASGKLNLSVNGRKVAVKPGHYTGAIILRAE
ncbi:hypothetical protein GTZ99_00195 [Novosphingobium sp. FSY-8]|uniref:Uncharacterized protein n=1 Tax=Novosphingobium ovatum TaxID=1908523 RepID=A0ABW9X8W4_9SPHN|nr:hypothetical protein [Novosphingobium ovatum]NBC34973.1 hypothetical protein [Novosphingobium ovatum]